MMKNKIISLILVVSILIASTPREVSAGMYDIPADTTDFSDMPYNLEENPIEFTATERQNSVSGTIHDLTWSNPDSINSNDYMVEVYCVPYIKYFNSNNWNLSYDELSKLDDSAWRETELPAVHCCDVDASDCGTVVNFSDVWQGLENIPVGDASGWVSRVAVSSILDVIVSMIGTKYGIGDPHSSDFSKYLSVFKYAISDSETANYIKYSRVKYYARYVSKSGSSVMCDSGTGKYHWELTATYFDKSSTGPTPAPMSQESIYDTLNNGYRIPPITSKLVDQCDTDFYFISYNPASTYQKQVKYIDSYIIGNTGYACYMQHSYIEIYKCKLDNDGKIMNSLNNISIGLHKYILNATLHKHSSARDQLESDDQLIKRVQKEAYNYVNDNYVEIGRSEFNSFVSIDTNMPVYFGIIDSRDDDRMAALQSWIDSVRNTDGTITDPYGFCQYGKFAQNDTTISSTDSGQEAEEEVVDPDDNLPVVTYPPRPTDGPERTEAPDGSGGSDDGGGHSCDHADVIKWLKAIYEGNEAEFKQITVIRKSVNKIYNRIDNGISSVVSKLDELIDKIPGSGSADDSQDTGDNSDVIEWLKKIHNLILAQIGIEVADDILDRIQSLITDKLTGVAAAVEEVSGSMETVFPFSIIFIPKIVFEVLAAEPVTPYKEIKLKTTDFQMGKVKGGGIDFSFTLDLSDFDELARIIRTCETVLFLFALIPYTINVVDLIRKGGLTDD